jgi:DNA-binding Lrp family transcriptional regulator
VKIDETDRQIVAILAADGRATNRSIAARLKLPETTLSARIRRLGERGVLRVTAVSDWEAAGYSWPVAICIRVAGRGAGAVATDVAELDDVIAVALVEGEHDVVAHALLSDREGLHDLCVRRLPGIEGVREASVDLITATVGMRVGATSEGVGGDTPLHFPSPAVPLDEVDRGLIEALAADGRQSNREIARGLGVSEGTIRSRRRRLETAGLVRVVAIADRAALGEIGAVAFVGVRVEGPSAEAVAARLAARPEVYMANVTVGAYDLMLSVVTANRDELDRFVAAHLTGAAGVREVALLEVKAVAKNEYRWTRLL